MKRQILVLLTLLALVFAGPVACKKAEVKAKDRLVGAWLIDADATLAELPEEEQAMAGMFIKMMQIGMEFTKDGALTMRVSMMGQKDEQTGTFEVVKVEGDTVTLRVTQPANAETGEAGDTAEMLAIFRGDDQIRFMPVAEEGEDVSRESIVLKRVTKEEIDKAMTAAPATPDLEQLLGGAAGEGILEALEQAEAVEGDAAVEGAEGADAEAAGEDAAPAAEDAAE